MSVMKRIIFLSLITILGLNVFAVTPDTQVNQEDKILHKTLDEIKKTYGNPISEESTWGGGIAVFKVSDSLYYSCYFKFPDAKCYQYMVSDKSSVSRVFEESNAVAAAQDMMANAFGRSAGDYETGSYGTWDLGGRDMVGNMPRPDFNGDEEGRVVVTITVDPNGNVIETRINNRTNTTNLQLRNAAIEAARKTKFNAINTASNQTGTITYYFKLK